MSTLNQEVRKALEVAALADRKSRDAREKADGAKQGAYVKTVDAAIKAESAETFSEVWESFKADMKSGAGNLVKTLGLEPDSREAGKYKVPGSLANAVTNVLGAMKAGVSLTDGEGNARSFGAIRKDLVAVREAKAKAEAEAALSNATPRDKLLAEVRALCERIAKDASALTDTEAGEVIAMLRAIVATESGDKQDEKKAA